jgi:hypothetical protein
MTYPIDKVRDRYQNDAMFHALVDNLRAAILRMDLTPSEVREAAMLACIMEERWPWRDQYTNSRKIKEPEFEYCTCTYGTGLHGLERKNPDVLCPAHKEPRCICPFFRGIPGGLDPTCPIQDHRDQWLKDKGK